MGSRGIWAFMGARTKRTLTVSWTGLFVMSLLMQYFAFTVAAPEAHATVQTGLIQIQKFANPWGPVNAGDEIGFDITVTNNSALPATNVHVVDELDPRFAWVLAPNTADDCRIEGAVGSQTLVCDDALMVPGDFFTVHVSAQTTAATCGLVENIASVTTAEPGFHQHEAIVEILCPELSVLKTADHDGPVTVGDADRLHGHPQQRRQRHRIRRSRLGHAPGRLRLDDRVPVGWLEPGRRRAVVGSR